MNKYIMLSVICGFICLFHFYFGAFSTYEFATGDSKFAFTVVTLFWMFMTCFFAAKGGLDE